MNSSSSNKRSCLSPGLWFILLFLCTGFALFSLATFPASAAIFASPTPTQENLWAYVNLPKPTHTPTSIPTSTAPPTDIPTLMPDPTEAPGEIVMEIVEESASNASSEQPAPAPSYGGSKYILVDISEQHMYVYDGDVLVYSFVASTGMDYSTRVGVFAVQSKIPNAYGSTWNIWMPNWLGIYWSGGLENGIHALPILSNGATLWAGLLGRPISYGCVVLGTYESKLLYDWAEIGTPVEIQW